ncbi:tryptophan--tRNA ligase [[Eubacterium] cellulosolvens]
MMANNEMVVTPWEVSGTIDYDKLIEKFGTEPINDDLLDRIKQHIGELHFYLRRKIFFSHRDLNWILDMYDKGQRICLYTGRGPSGDIHIGHVVPWIFTKYLQDKFDAKLYFQLTDDEKFLINPSLSTKKVLELMYDNALDIIATGFDEKKTFIISDMKHAGIMYNIALQVAKHVTGSTAKAVFGFTDSSNIGIQFFPAVQAVPSFLDSIIEGKNVPCLIPAAIDQDPYWRVTRDIAPKIGFYKPAQIHSRFLPGLGVGGKMSSSMPETCIFLKDPPKVAQKKIMNAYTGGRATVEEQRKLGGDPSICSIYYYESFIFEPDDRRLRKIEADCRSGALLCGEHKRILAEKVNRFLLEHREKREKLKDKFLDYFLDSNKILKKILQ